MRGLADADGSFEVGRGVAIADDAVSVAPTLVDATGRVGRAVAVAICKSETRITAAIGARAGVPVATYVLAVAVSVGALLA